jgi:hypothetical protein
MLAGVDAREAVMTELSISRVLLFGVLGLVLGLAQLVSLRAVVRRYVSGSPGPRTFVLQIARLVPIAGAWVLLARMGSARGLLAAFVGFLVARVLVTRAARKVPS